MPNVVSEGEFDTTGFLRIIDNVFNVFLVNLAVLLDIVQHPLLLDSVIVVKDNTELFHKHSLLRNDYITFVHETFFLLNSEQDLGETAIKPVFGQEEDQHAWTGEYEREQATHFTEHGDQRVPWYFEHLDIFTQSNIYLQ